MAPQTGCADKPEHILISEVGTAKVQVLTAVFIGKSHPPYTFLWPSQVMEALTSPTTWLSILEHLSQQEQEKIQNPELGFLGAKNLHVITQEWQCLAPMAEWKFQSLLHGQDSEAEKKN